ncbi:MAG: hypothetical protein LBI33_06585 [Propionibacteriaceae bacterium]|jgi:hypothetical protein|nr:hypothetical protein [Propionibacteriaceae bacterium]
MKKSIIQGVALPFLVLTLLMVSVPTVWADDDQFHANQIATMIDEAAPDTSPPVAVPEQTNDLAAVTVGTTLVEIPTSASNVVELGSLATDAATLSPVTISLPKEVRNNVHKGRGKVAKDGTMVYLSDLADGTDAAVQGLSDGSVRIQTIAHSGKGKLKYTYEIGGGVPIMQADGSVHIVQMIDNGSVKFGMTVAIIEPAWAVDAMGEPVATWYEVTVKGELVQVVSPAKSTVFPVIADPKAVWTWLGPYVEFNRAETRKLGSTTASGMLVILGGAGLVAWPLGVVALVAGYINWYAGDAYNKGACYRYNVLLFPALPAHGRYTGGNCT